MTLPNAFDLTALLGGSRGAGRTLALDHCLQREVQVQRRGSSMTLMFRVCILKQVRMWEDDARTKVLIRFIPYFGSRGS